MRKLRHRAGRCVALRMGVGMQAEGKSHLDILQVGTLRPERESLSPDRQLWPWTHTVSGQPYVPFVIALHSHSAVTCQPESDSRLSEVRAASGSGCKL